MKRQALHPPKPGLLSGAHKLMLGTITTAAALMTLLLNAKALGVSSWLGVLEPNLADHAARRIVLTPRSDTLRAIGDTAAIVATVTDARGATLAGASLRWRSSDSTVASVDSGGNIVARAAGRATVEVRVREVTASASIVVRPTAAALRIAGDSALRLSTGDSARVAVVAVDARGHRVRGLAARWATADTAIVSVDSAGAILARRAGRAEVVATLGEHRASAFVEVVLTPAELVVVDGAAQRALAGRPLGSPLILQVRTRHGEAVPGIEVRVESEDRDASFTPAVATTDAQGRARIQWTLGRRAGVQRAVARVATLDTTLLVAAEADPNAQATRVELMATELRGVVGEPTTMPVLVQVRDTSGVALEGVRVTWTALDGGTAQGMAATDVSGNIEARWTLGPKAGPQRLRLQVGDPRHFPATTIRAVARAAAPERITGSSAKSGVKGDRLVSARVLDAHGNPVADVSLTITTTAGTVAEANVRTDSLGRARVLWTPAPRPSATAAKSASKRAPPKPATPEVRLTVQGTRLALVLPMR